MKYYLLKFIIYQFFFNLDYVEKLKCNPTNNKNSVIR